MILAGDWAPGKCRVTITSTRIRGDLLCNLEGPILRDASKPTQSPKAGPHLYHESIPPNACRTVFVLANNHIMDYGMEGLERTREFLEQRSCRYVGAGSQCESEAPLYFDSQETRYGLLSRCEAQFGVATASRPGVAMISPNLYRQISETKQNSDLVVVSVHQASEMSPWPSPRTQELYRSLIDAGADIIHGHHAHVPQGFESYGNGMIFYGLGNFCVTPSHWRGRANCDWSLIVDMPGVFHKQPDAISSLRLRFRSDDAVEIQDPTPEEKRDTNAYLADCNCPLGNPDLLRGLWQENAVYLFERHYMSYLGFNDGLRSSLRRYVRRWTGQSNYDALLRYVLLRCESHVDAISEAIGLMSGELPDYRTVDTALLAKKYLTNE